MAALPNSLTFNGETYELVKTGSIDTFVLHVPRNDVPMSLNLYDQTVLDDYYLCIYKAIKINGEYYGFKPFKTKTFI